MAFSIVVLSGAVATGKTTLADELEQRFGAQRIGSHELLLARLGQGERRDRSALQTLGERLDRESGGRWLADEPVDVLAADELRPGGGPVKVRLQVSGVRDGWTVADDVALGSAWLVKDQQGAIKAFSATCPHLGCAIDFDTKAGSFACPCHKSEFALSGDRVSGPAKRGLDPLPLRVADGRIKITFKRFVQDIADRIEV